MTSPIITLTTDFGLQDHYVGTMKGVILGRCPQAQLIDITHEIEPFSIYAGAYAIAQTAPYFPAGTVHLVVVDPGVGTERRPLLIEAREQYFIAPDNGVLSLILARHREARVREISNRDLWLPSPSATFHGRDVFAPVAGSLATGQVRPSDVGPIVKGATLLPDLEPVKLADQRWRGIVLSADRFGNVITNFESAALLPRFTLTVGSVEVTKRRETFGNADPGVCFVYAGSSGYLEIGMNQASAGKLLAVGPGDPVMLDFGY